MILSSTRQIVRFCSGKFVWDYSEDKLSDGYNNWSEEEPNNDDDGEECVEKVRK